MSKYVERHEEVISSDGFLERVHETVKIRLKLCPFCGGKGAHATALNEDNEEKDVIVCTSCEARTACFESLEEAVDAWNERANA